MSTRSPQRSKESTTVIRKATQGAGLNHAPLYSSLEMLSLEETLASLEDEEPSQPQILAQDFACILRRCRTERNVACAMRIHTCIRRRGMEAHPYLGNQLVSMLAEAGRLSDAHQLFIRLTHQQDSSWNSLITSFVRADKLNQALRLYKALPQDSVHINHHTFVALLKACAKLKDLESGIRIHAHMARRGIPQDDVFVGSSLVNMYAKCGLPLKAQEVFDQLRIRNAVSWNTLIAGYAQHGCGDDALKHYERMQVEGILPNAVTFVCILKACSTTGAIGKGQQIHADISKKGWETNLYVSGALVDMYAKCGLLTKAQEVFDNFSARDVVSWTALIAGYSQHGNGEKALMCFEQMQIEGTVPDAVTFVCSLKACGILGATGKGQNIHADVARKGALETDLVVGTALVDMYANCGLISEAQEVFEKLKVRDIVLWSALIAGYAQLGEIEVVFKYFKSMIREGIMPNVASFVTVLNACSHAGLLEKGQMYFEGMVKDYGVVPTLEHHTCIVDLLGRAGQLDKALEIIKMSYHADIVIWRTLMGSCKKWSNVELGRHAFKCAMHLDWKDPAAYVCMSNIYWDVDMQEENEQDQGHK